MRQPGFAIDQTGTDHNPLTNSMLLAGKGIRGGIVISESDRRAPDERVSKAHAGLDPQALKIMGSPSTSPRAARVRTCPRRTTRPTT